MHRINTMAINNIKKTVFKFILSIKMLVPKYLSHTSENPFTLYGFKYKTMAHFFAVQQAAAKGLPFKHLFNAEVTDLPKLVYVRKAIVNEGVEAMLAQSKHDIRSIPDAYASTHPVLGIGTSKLRLAYGDKKRGRNLYGKSIQTVLKRRKVCK